MKCTWLNCKQPADKPQVDTHGVVWANLCFLHDAKLDAATDDQDMQKLLVYMDKARGGRKPS